MYVRKRTYRKKRAVVRKRAAKRIYKRKSNLNRRVKSIVKGMAEKKQTTSTQINVALTSGDSSVLVPYIALCPPLSQGSAENGRIGNSVSVTSGVISGYVNMLPYNATTNTFTNLKVRMMLVSQKIRNTTSTLASTLTVSDFDTFFDNGANGVPFQGTMYDILAPVNSQRWTVHADRILTLALTNSNATYGNTTAPSNSGVYQQAFKFYFGKQLGKLIYDDTVGSQLPTNKNLYLVVQPITSDGSARQAGPIAEIHYKYDVHYVDL